MNSNNHRKMKDTWAKGPPKQNFNTTGQVTSPWEVQPEDMLDEFERQLNVSDAAVKAPWEEDSDDIRAQMEKAQSAQNYQYHSMFEVPKMTDKELQKIANYNMNPPFCCDFNNVEEKKRDAKRMDVNKNPVTRKPWTYGAAPPDPVTRRIHERPKTALWVEDKNEPFPKKKQEFVSSGDPILDSLRSQLLSRGAAGIAGLSRKFRIMDDDGSGSLDLEEFRKGMKECEVIDLTERAIKHLFGYFGMLSALISLMCHHTVTFTIMLLFLDDY